MNTLRQGDMYYDERSALSPPMHPRQSQSQTLRHQSSRQNFGGFGQQHQPQQSQQGGMYTLDEIASRYDVPRYNERMDASLQSSYNGYDYPPQQGWNTNSYAHNNTLAAIGATTRGKPSSRGRSNLPSVSSSQCPADTTAVCGSLTDPFVDVDGSTSAHCAFRWIFQSWKWADGHAIYAFRNDGIRHR